MLNAEAQAVLDAAMKLSPEDRHIVADLMWMSIDNMTAEEIDREWEEEIARRLDAHERGETQSIDGEEVLKALKEGRIP